MKTNLLFTALYGRECKVEYSEKKNVTVRCNNGHTLAEHVCIVFIELLNGASIVI